jgi:hypothetical protein
MRTLLISIVLLAIASLATASHTQQPAKPRNLKVVADYNKKEDVTTVILEELEIWRNPLEFEIVGMNLLFIYPQKTIVKPREVIVRFNAVSRDTEAFPTWKFAAVIDGTKVDLPDLEGQQASLSRRPNSSIHEGRWSKIGYETFARMVQAQKLTLIVGDRKYKISNEHLLKMRDFHELMQREGQEIN